MSTYEKKPIETEDTILSQFQSPSRSQVPESKTPKKI